MAKSSSKKPPAAASQPASAHPLFFRDPHPVDAARHAVAGIRRDVGFAFARDTNSVPLTMQEFVEAARSYPIVFTNEPLPMPIAVLGLKKTNRFVDSAGRWARGHYIPAYVRKYPFALLELREKKQFILCIDEGAAHYASDRPELPLYDGREPAALATQAIDECSRYHSQYLGTRQFAEMLRDAGLLEAKEMHAELPGREHFAIGGFQMIAEDKWNALPNKEFLHWRDKQWVGLIYLAMASQVNWKYLGQLEADA